MSPLQQDDPQLPSLGAKHHPTSFSSWLKENRGLRVGAGLVLLGIVADVADIGQVLANAIGPSTSKHIDALLETSPALFQVLILTGFTFRMWKLKVPDTQSPEMGPISEFFRRWQFAWSMWIGMYVFYLLFKADFFQWGASPAYSTVGLALLHLLNNTQSAAVFLCFHSLGRPIYFDGERRSPILPLAIVIPVAFFLELFFVKLLGTYAVIVAEATTTITGGAAIALLAGRIESRYIRPPLRYIAMLYVYAVIQPVFILHLAATEHLMKEWVADYAVYSRSPEFGFMSSCVAIAGAYSLGMKVVLFLLMQWMIEKNRLLDYFKAANDRFSATREVPGPSAFLPTGTDSDVELIPARPPQPAVASQFLEGPGRRHIDRAFLLLDELPDHSRVQKDEFLAAITHAESTRNARGPVVSRFLCVHDRNDIVYGLCHYVIDRMATPHVAISFFIVKAGRQSADRLDSAAQLVSYPEVTRRLVEAVANDISGASPSFGGVAFEVDDPRAPNPEDRRSRSMARLRDLTTICESLGMQCRYFDCNYVAPAASMSNPAAVRCSHLLVFAERGSSGVYARGKMSREKFRRLIEFMAFRVYGASVDQATPAGSAYMNALRQWVAETVPAPRRAIPLIPTRELFLHRNPTEPR